jgi:hypothetical protein
MTSIGMGILVGCAVALVQSLITTLALRWALKKPFFYWVWGGGIVLRVVVLLVMALLVSQHTQLNMMATLLSLVVATTIFLIVETKYFLTK